MPEESRERLAGPEGISISPEELPGLYRNLVEGLEALYAFRTGLTPPLTFGPSSPPLQPTISRAAMIFDDCSKPDLFIFQRAQRA